MKVVSQHSFMKMSSMLLLVLVFSLQAAASSKTITVCHKLTDADDTRAVIEYMGPQIVSFVLVTPELKWETEPVLVSELAYLSPNMVNDTQFNLSVLDKDGEQRMFDFSVKDPDAFPGAEGFRGSLAIHDTVSVGGVPGSLYYETTGNLLVVEPVFCITF